MSRLFPGLGLTFLLVLSVAPLHGEQSDCQNHKFIASVVDRNGALLPDLNPADFQASYHGQPLQIVSVSKIAHASRIALVLDTSSSMKYQVDHGPSSLEHTSEAFLRFLPADIPLALVIFSERVQLTVEFGGSRQKIQEALDGVFHNPAAWKGRTALYDAVRSAISLFDRPQPGDAILVMSDGEDTASTHSPSKVSRVLIRSGIRLFAFLPIFPGSPLTDRLNSHGLQDMANASGGIAVIQEVRDLKDKGSRTELATLAGNIFSRLLGGYQIEIALTDANTKTQQFKLTVKEPIAEQRKVRKVEYAAKLMPCRFSQDTVPP